MKLCFVGAAAQSVPVDAQTLYISNDWASRQALLSRGIKPVHLEDVFAPEENDALMRQVTEAAARWHHVGAEDLTRFANLSLGAPLDWTLWWRTFIPVFKTTTAAARLIQQTTPSEILWGSGLDPRWELALLAARDRWAPHAPVRYLTARNAELDTSVNSRTLRLATITRRHQVAFAASNLVSRIARLARRGRRPLVYFNYQTLNGMLGAILRDPLRRFDVLFANRPEGQMWLSGLAQGAQFLLPASYTLTANETRELERLRKRWHELCATPEYQARFCWSGVDAWPILQNDLDSVFAHDLPITARLARGYQQALSDARPACITMPSDAPYLQRLLIEVARPLNIPSIVLLHGLPPTDDRFGEYLQADYVFAWGPAMQDLFAGFGSALQRIKTVGFPKLDAYYDRKNEYARRKAQRTSCNILILGQTKSGHVTIIGTDDEAEVHLQNVLEALQGLPGIRLSVRPHPSERGDYYGRFLAGLGIPDIPVWAGGPIEPVLQEVDLVIGEASTVMVEAFAMGIPSLCVQFRRAGYSEPYDGNSGIEVIPDSITLRQRVSQFLHGEWHDPGWTVLPSYVGEMDGRATQRTLDALSEIAA